MIINLANTPLHQVWEIAIRKGIVIPDGHMYSVEGCARTIKAKLGDDEESYFYKFDKNLPKTFSFITPTEAYRHGLSLDEDADGIYISESFKLCGLQTLVNITDQHMELYVYPEGCGNGDFILMSENQNSPALTMISKFINCCNDLEINLSMVNEMFDMTSGSHASLESFEKNIKDVLNTTKGRPAEPKVIEEKFLLNYPTKLRENLEEEIELYHQAESFIRICIDKSFEPLLEGRLSTWVDRNIGTHPFALFSEYVSEVTESINHMANDNKYLEERISGHVAVLEFFEGIKEQIDICIKDIKESISE